MAKAPTKRKAAPKKAAAPRKRDAKGRAVPATRKPGGGRKKSTPMRQHYTNMQPARRSPPPVPTSGTAALSGNPPTDLGPAGRFLWKLLVTQQQDAEGKGIAPTVGMESYALAHQYASAFDRWAEVKKTIKHLEAEFPARDRHLAKWVIDGKGNYTLHGVWQTEVSFRKAAADAAQTLGLGVSHPAVALQVNMNGQPSAVADDPTKKLIGPYREAAKVIDAVEVMPAQ